jgi:hypothetical protein
MLFLSTELKKGRTLTRAAPLDEWFECWVVALLCPSWLGVLLETSLEDNASAKNKLMTMMMMMMMMMMKLLKPIEFKLYCPFVSFQFRQHEPSTIDT